MKIKILEDAHFSVSSGLSQSFAAGSTVDVPRATAEALVARGVAEVIDKSKRSDKGDK